MSHYSRVLRVVIDAPPDLHDQELAFWQGALGQELPGIYSAEHHGAFLRGNDLMLLMQRLGSGAPRVHLDIHADDLDAEVARLERLGAGRVQKVRAWQVMRDPAGLLFCVLPASPGFIERRERPALGVIMTAKFQLVIDCADPEPLARFWVAALGYEFEPPPDGYGNWDDYWRAVGVSEDELGLGLDCIADPAGRGPRIWFQVVPEKKTLKNRLHLDITVSGGRANPIEARRRLVDAEARRLEALGATLVRVICEDGVDHYGVAMRDPEGNEFDIN